MKKIIFSIIIIFLFINDASAQNIETKLTNIKENIVMLREEVDDLNTMRLNKKFPIGSIYITTTYATKEDVKNVIGGIWEEYGNGKTLVGVDENNSNFNVVNNSGGKLTTTLVSDNLPNHTHTIPSLSATTSKDGSHYHNVLWNGGSPVTITYESGTVKVLNINKFSWVNADADSGTWYQTNSAGAHTHTFKTNENKTGNIGSATSFTNLEPYITVYMYKRIA